MQIKFVFSPEQVQLLSPTIEQRFWSKVDKNGPTQTHCPELGNCWIWTGGKYANGYGVIGLGRKGAGLASSHRVSWFLHNGEIPTGYYVLHRCDEPSCVRPDHLWLGTKRDNSRDMAKKGRSCVGEKNGMTKLTWQKVRLIRKLHSTGNYSQDAIGKLFQCSQSMVGRIVRGESWKE